MEVRRNRNNNERSISAWDRNGERLGFASKERRPDGIRYGIGIDNVGDPYRGVLDRELNTPLGTIDYGYDGDTVGAGFTPRSDAYYDLLNRLGSYNNGDERGVYANLTGNDQVGLSTSPYGDAGAYYDRNGRNMLSAGIRAITDGTKSVGGSVAAPVNQDYYNEIDTPLGLIGYGADAQRGNVYGDFTPRNQYYIQALANLLSRQR
jgi:hypothetical protein